MRNAKPTFHCIAESAGYEDHNPKTQNKIATGDFPNTVNENSKFFSVMIIFTTTFTLSTLKLLKLDVPYAMRKK